MNGCNLEHSCVRNRHNVSRKVLEVEVRCTEIFKHLATHSVPPTVATLNEKRVGVYGDISISLSSRLLCTGTLLGLAILKAKGRLYGNNKIFLFFLVTAKAKFVSQAARVNGYGEAAVIGISAQAQTAMKG